MAFLRKVFSGSKSPEHMDMPERTAHFGAQRKKVEPHLGAGTDAPLFVYPCHAVKGLINKDKIPGTLVVTTERVIFAPDQEGSLRHELTRKGLDSVVWEDDFLKLSAGDEGMARIVIDKAKATLLQAELLGTVEHPTQPSARQLETAKSTETGTFFLTLCGAKNLLAMDTSGKSDPFVRASLQYPVPGKDKQKEDSSTTLQTKYVEQSLAPKWKETFHWDVTEGLPSSVKVRIYDYDLIGGNDQIGHTDVMVELSPQVVNEWLLLSTDSGLNLNSALKTTIAVAQKVGKGAKDVTQQAGGKVGGIVGVDVNPRSPRRRKDATDPLEEGEPDIPDGSVEQYVHTKRWWKKAPGTPCHLLVGLERVAGVLFVLEDHFAFVDEAGRVLCRPTYQESKSLEWTAAKDVVLRTRAAIYIFNRFQSKVNYQAVYNASKPKFGVVPELTKKGPVERMPSVINLRGAVPIPAGQLKVNVIEGMNLVAKDKVDGVYAASDPYVKVTLLDRAQKPVHETEQETEPIYSTLMPVWDETFFFDVPAGTLGLLLTVWDRDPGGFISNNDDFMGQFTIFGMDLLELLDEDTGVWEGWKKLEKRVGRQERVSGKVRLNLAMDPKVLAEADEPEEDMGIDAFNPRRRNSVTKLDFEATEKFSTFNGTYKGDPCRVWVSPEGLAMYSDKTRLRASWMNLMRMQKDYAKKDGKEYVQGITLKGPERSLFIFEPEPEGLKRLERTFQRFKNSMRETMKLPTGDLPSTMSFIQMHPSLTQLVHGALTGNHFKTLVFIWLVMSLFLFAPLSMTGPLFCRLMMMSAVGVIVSWWVEHVEFGLDWAALIREREYPLVEEDINDAVAGLNVSTSTRVVSFLAGVLFVVAGSMPSVDTASLAFPFMAALLVIVRTMLHYRQK